jgi:hypothetical protein
MAGRLPNDVSTKISILSTLLKRLGKVVVFYRLGGFDGLWLERNGLLSTSVCTGANAQLTQDPNPTANPFV